jgi:hypothetical protein
VLVLRGQKALAGFLAECFEDPIGAVERTSDIRTPFDSGPTWPVYERRGFRVFVAETAQGRFEVFEVPADAKLLSE